MDYEKKYKEALERAKKFEEKYGGGYAEYIFPELRESEDERIRKWLVDYFDKIGSEAWIHREFTCEQILAWLEKQKEPENTSASTMAPSCWEVEQKEQKPKAKAKSPLSPHELYDAKIEGISQGRQDVLDHPEQFGLQKPAEWSEEDEKMINSIINVVCGVGSQPNGLREKQVSFLKSLRPSWKPSEEQMVALDGVIVNCKLNEITKYLLVSLYNDLKKL